MRSTYTNILFFSKYMYTNFYIQKVNACWCVEFNRQNHCRIAGLGGGSKETRGVLRDRHDGSIDLWLCDPTNHLLYFQSEKPICLLVLYPPTNYDSICDIQHVSFLFLWKKCRVHFLLTASNCKF